MKLGFWSAIFNLALAAALLRTAMSLISYGHVVAFLFGILYIGLAALMVYFAMEELR